MFKDIYIYITKIKLILAYNFYIKQKYYFRRIVYIYKYINYIFYVLLNFKIIK